jgi:hypothetical protein
LRLYGNTSLPSKLIFCYGKINHLERDLLNVGEHVQRSKVPFSINMCSYYHNLSIQILPTGVIYL